MIEDRILLIVYDLQHFLTDTSLTMGLQERLR
jgi:hypothetical protein